MKRLLLAALLLSGCEPHDLDVPRIEDQPSMDEFTRARAESLYLKTHGWVFDSQDDALSMPKGWSQGYHYGIAIASREVTNTGPHAVVLSDGERCLLLRPGESGVWSGPAEISTPDGYEKEDIK